MLSADLLCADPLSAARRLLGGLLSAGGVRARIVEVEAYGGPPDGPWPDPAAHSYRGPTPRNTVMFGPPGRLYTYRSYGLHLCANISCGEAGAAGAVLLRAAVLESGEQSARERRGAAVPRVALARGPGNLCAALAIGMDNNGIDVFAPGAAVRVQLATVPAALRSGPRVGVSAAADRPWRLWLPGHAEVSAYRRSSRAPRAGAEDLGERLGGFGDPALGSIVSNRPGHPSRFRRTK